MGKIGLFRTILFIICFDAWYRLCDIRLVVCFNENEICSLWNRVYRFFFRLWFAPACIGASMFSIGPRCKECIHRIWSLARVFFVLSIEVIFLTEAGDTSGDCATIVFHATNFQARSLIGSWTQFDGSFLHVSQWRPDNLFLSTPHWMTHSNNTLMPFSPSVNLRNGSVIFSQNIF